MTKPRTKDRRDAAGRVLAPSLLISIAVLATACQGSPAATASPSEVSTEPSASAASESAEPSESASDTAACLDSEVVAAIDELDQGNLDTDPGLDEVADQLESLHLDGAADDARDSLVDALRDDAPEANAIVSAILNLKSQVALPEC